jgi:hypothetical protein
VSLFTKQNSPRPIYGGVRSCDQLQRRVTVTFVERCIAAVNFHCYEWQKNVPIDSVRVASLHLTRSRRSQHNRHEALI